MKYDLEDRTLTFGKEIVHLCKALPANTVNFRLIDQIIRSGTSMGANYREANETETKKDFKHKIRICLRECKETGYWLELLKEANPDYQDKLNKLAQENSELRKIFAAILIKSE
jgi:four helix bundle protein